MNLVSCTGGHDVVTFKEIDFATTTGCICSSDGLVDSNLTASNLNVSADGKSLTATLAVNGNAALGRRVVIVSTASSRSQLADIGTNTIEITQ